MDDDAAADDQSGTAGELAVNKYVTQRTMREFIGLESSADAQTRDALMNFSYHLTAGNMDEAFKAIKLIKRLFRSQFLAVRIQRIRVGKHGAYVCQVSAVGCGTGVPWSNAAGVRCAIDATERRSTGG